MKLVVTPRLLFLLIVSLLFIVQVAVAPPLPATAQIIGHQMFLNGTQANITITPHTARSPIADFRQGFQVCNNNGPGPPEFIFVNYTFNVPISEQRLWVEQIEDVEIITGYGKYCTNVTEANSSIAQNCSRIVQYNATQEQTIWTEKTSFVTTVGNSFVLTQGQALANGVCKNFKMRYKTPGIMEGKWDLHAYSGNTPVSWNCWNDSSCNWEYVADPWLNSSCTFKRNFTIVDKGLTKAVNISFKGNTIIDPVTTHNQSNITVGNAAEDTILPFLVNYINSTGDEDNQDYAIFVNVTDTGGSFFVYYDCNLLGRQDDVTTGASAGTVVHSYWNWDDGDLQGWTNIGDACAATAQSDQALYGTRMGIQALNSTVDASGDGCSGPTLTGITGDVADVFNIQYMIGGVVDAVAQSKDAVLCAGDEAGTTCESGQANLYAFVDVAGDTFDLLIPGETPIPGMLYPDADTPDWNQITLNANWTENDPTVCGNVNGTAGGCVENGFRNANNEIQSFATAGGADSNFLIDNLIIWAMQNTTTLTIGAELSEDSDGFFITQNQPTDNKIFFGSRDYSFNITVVGTDVAYNISLHINATIVDTASAVLNDSLFQFNYTPIVDIGAEYNWSLNGTNPGATIQNDTGNFSFNVTTANSIRVVTLNQPANSTVLFGSRDYSHNFTIDGSIATGYSATFHVNASEVFNLTSLANDTLYQFNFTPPVDIDAAINWSVNVSVLGDDGLITAESGNFTYNVSDVFDTNNSGNFSLLVKLCE